VVFSYFLKKQVILKLKLLIICFLVGWSDWNEWSKCNSSCMKTRDRNCFSFNHTENYCSGNSTEITYCNELPHCNGN
jgi:hypothetical protein